MKSVPVTIITPVYNCEAYIVETVKSILSQNYKDLEYIVINDGSSDATLDRLRQFGDQIKLIDQDNIGEQASVNKGVSLATNDIIAIVNADDPILDGLIEKSANILSEDPSLVAVYPDWYKINAQGDILDKKTTQEYDYLKMLEQSLCIPGPGAFFRKSALGNTPARNVNFRYTGDFDLWLRLGLVGKMKRIPEFLATWRYHNEGASFSQRNLEMAINRIDVIEGIFENEKFPEEYRKYYKQALSTAYYCAGIVATHSSEVPGRKLMIKSIITKPKWPNYFIKSQKRSWLHILYIFLKPLSSSLYSFFIGNKICK